jgi:hypothetical protein
MINVSGGDYMFTDETYIGFNEAATKNFDGQFDAIKLFGLENAPQLYSVGIDDQYLALNILPPDLTVEVPLHFSNGYSGEFSLYFQDISSFSTGTKIILHDLKLGTQMDLSLYPDYQFTYHQNDDPGRFMLTFSGLLSSKEVHGGEALTISVSKDRIILESPEANGKLTLFNLLGQYLGTYTVTSPGTIVPVAGGQVYIVRIITKSGSTFERLFVP